MYTKCYITLKFEIRFFEPLFFYFIKEWLQIKHKDTLVVWAGNKWELSTLSINKKRNAPVITCIYTYRTSQTKNSDTKYRAGKINNISKQNCKTSEILIEWTIFSFLLTVSTEIGTTVIIKLWEIKYHCPDNNDGVCIYASRIKRVFCVCYCYFFIFILVCFKMVPPHETWYFLLQLLTCSFKYVH